MGSLIIVIGVGIFGTFTGYLANLFLTPSKNATLEVGDAQTRLASAKNNYRFPPRCANAASARVYGRGSVGSHASVVPSRARRSPVSRDAQRLPRVL